MLATYRFSTISSTLVITSGDAAASELGCVSVSITPSLGSSLADVLRYIPLVILVFVGGSVITAAIYSPWGSTDPFRWTSNYGRDQDVLRLVTPGFADCLQYIQFTVLTGALSLDYPGYYQPVVSQAAWSSLLFNQSFLDGGQGRDAVMDGLYAPHGIYGLDRMSQLIGMGTPEDIWPGMMVWLLVILLGLTLVIQIAFASRWLHRKIAHIPEEDLRAKNMPFTVGNAIRVLFNYLLLPVVSLSFFQFVIAGQSHAYLVALAAVVILALAIFFVWFVRLIVSTKHKAYLFDDLPTVLLYGPLYNTYCDDAAAFALVPIFVNFARGVAIGALQPSGIAQIVLLAICEVITILSLVAFRPFPSPSSMNFYHSCFSLVRFLAILLSVTFVPSLQVSEAARGWIGYVVLLLHGLVLVFGFFLNALQTLIEVIARLAGAGGNEDGATRGGLAKVLGMRQLSRRGTRRDVTARQSMGSEAAMLAPLDERMSTQYEGSSLRPRSLSGSSALLLHRAAASDGRISVAYESLSGYGGGMHSRANSSGLYTPTTPVGPNNIRIDTSISGPAGYPVGNDSPRSTTLIGFPQPQDPYYRPPRPRRRTMETHLSTDDQNSNKNQSSIGARSSNTKNLHGEDAEDEDEDDLVQGTTPAPAHLSASKDDLDYDESRQPRATDYAVREVDFYYRVRGPPLSQTGTRKLKTGPADPTGPVSSATGWFRNVFAFRGKSKEKNKGFEVVRGSRAPLPPPSGGVGSSTEVYHKPYRDEPEADDGPVPSERRLGLGTNSQCRDPEDEAGTSLHNTKDNNNHTTTATTTDNNNNNENTKLPQLPRINSGGSIELPSRMGSQKDKDGDDKTNSNSNNNNMNVTHRAILPAVQQRPAVPRKSSRRQSSVASADFDPDSDSSVKPPTNHPPQPSLKLSDPGRLPFSAVRRGASLSSRSRDDEASISSTQSSSHGGGDDPSSAGIRTRLRTRTTTGSVGEAGHEKIGRPSTMGYVAHHRARDNIYEVDERPGVVAIGSTAELVDTESVD